MNEPARQLFDFDGYLMLEHESPIKHEFLDGHVWAMAGGSQAHARVAMNVATLLQAQLRGKACEAFGSDFRVRVPATGLTTYPDISVFCGRVVTDPDDRKGETATNPVVLVEVLSPSTQAYDRGEKRAHYQQLDSLRELVLIAHDAHRVELWHRDGQGEWTETVFTGEDTVRLASIPCELPLLEIYRSNLPP